VPRVPQISPQKKARNFARTSGLLACSSFDDVRLIVSSERYSCDGFEAGGLASTRTFVYYVNCFDRDDSKPSSLWAALCF
jgi:hypothetical protein